MFVSWRIWLTYTLLLTLAIPWYWRFVPGAMTVVCGLPLWVFSSLVFSSVISAFTGWLLRERWPGEASGDSRS